MNKISLVISVFSVVFLLIAWVSYTKSGTAEISNYKENLEYAEQFTQQGLYYRAIDCYESAIEYKPTEENWMKIIETCKLNCKEYPDYESTYIDFLTEANELFPKNADFVLDLADYYNKNGYNDLEYKLLTTSIENGVKDEKVVELQHKIKYDYSINDTSFVEFKGAINGEFPVSNGKYWGIMETSGSLGTDFKYDYYGPFNDSRTRLRDEVDKEKKTRLYDGENEVLAKFEFSVLDCGTLSEGLIAIKDSDSKLFYFYSEYGIKHFENLGGFQKVSNFYNGLAAVEQNNLWGIISNEGKFVVEPQYKEIVIDNYGYYNKNEICVACKDNEYFLCNEKLKQQGNFVAEKIDIPTSDGVLAFCKGGKWGFINTDGKILMDAEYEKAKSFSNGFAAVCKGGKWGFINSLGELVINCEFFNADYFNSDGSVCVSLTSTEDDENQVWLLLVLTQGLVS